MLVLLAEHTSQANKKPRAGAHPRLYSTGKRHTQSIIALRQAFRLTRMQTGNL